MEGDRAGLLTDLPINERREQTYWGKRTYISKCHINPAAPVVVVSWKFRFKSRYAPDRSSAWPAKMPKS